MTTLDRSKLIPTFVENFDLPLSIWNCATKQGRWKTNFAYGNPVDASSRTAASDVAVVVDQAYCGINPFGQWNGPGVYVTVASTTSTDPKLGGKLVTAGNLTTERTFQQVYGYFECRFATPSVPGCWPAFWLYSAPVKDLTGTQWDNGLGYGPEWVDGLMNEIDVVEILTNNTQQTNHTAHARQAWLGGKPGNGFDPNFVPVQAGTQVVPNAGTTWMHSYGVLWLTDTITWYVDDNVVFSAPNPGIHDPMMMIVGMGAGGWNNNALPQGFTQALMPVEYVRAYSYTDF